MCGSSLKRWDDQLATLFAGFDHNDMVTVRSLHLSVLRFAVGRGNQLSRPFSYGSVTGARLESV